jgi:cytochrome c553
VGVVPGKALRCLLHHPHLQLLPTRGRRVPSRNPSLMMIRPLLVLIATLVPLAAQAGDAAAGKKRATACQTCHGMDGLSKLPEAPNLAGQVEPYLVKALTEYRDGKRQNEIMNVVAKELSDADIANLAAYYSGIQIDVLPPG